MVDRWSKVALSVSNDVVTVFGYCHNYTTERISRSGDPLSFSDGSLLLIGHAGSALMQAFDVSLHIIPSIITLVYVL